MIFTSNHKELNNEDNLNGLNDEEPVNEDASNNKSSIIEEG